MVSGALVGRDGSVDWLCLPRFDSDACFAALLGAPEHGRWLIAPEGEVRRTRRRYRPGTAILETTFETDEGEVAGDRLHAAQRRCRARRSDPHRPGRARRGADAHRADRALRLRQRGAVGAAAGFRHQRDRGPGRAGAAHRGRSARRGFHDDRRVQRRRGCERAVHPRLPPLLSPPGAAARCFSLPRGDRAVLDRMVRAVRVWRSRAAALARCRGALADHAEMPVVPSDRRHHRGAHDLAARAAGRRAQLGLPLLLDPGCDAYALRAAQLRLPRRGAGVARVAGARGRRAPGRAPGDLRHRGRAAPDRARAAVAAGLRGQPARAHRQRRVRAAADRRLGRAHGRGACRPQVRDRGQPRGLARAEGR